MISNLHDGKKGKEWCCMIKQEKLDIDLLWGRTVENVTICTWLAVGSSKTDKQIGTTRFDRDC